MRTLLTVVLVTLLAGCTSEGSVLGSLALRSEDAKGTTDGYYVDTVAGESQAASNARMLNDMRRQFEERERSRGSDTLRGCGGCS